MATLDKKIKAVTTEVSIKSSSPHWNPIFNSIKVGPVDEGGGSFLKITGDDEENEGSSVTIDWEEWDMLVQVVEHCRIDWEWKK